MNVVLINPYEIGRQPFGLAEPAAWLEREGCTVHCLDLSIQALDPALLAMADLVALYVPMHTATRIAVEAIAKIRGYAPDASLCVFGLYAPMNADLFESLGVSTILGGEIEPALAALVKRLRTSGTEELQPETTVCLDKIEFLPPDRYKLPPLDRYAQLVMPDGSRKTVGFAETTRGCKYLCRHCPVAPVYHGIFRVIPEAIVLDDIRAQIARGAEHVSFGDPDFFNGPGHALRIVRALHREFPHITYDATIKIEHLVRYPDEIRELGETGCLFIVSAVESVDNRILAYLDKGHTREDFLKALAFLRETAIVLSPTFVAFTPWTTLEGYIELLQDIFDLRLVESVAPVQLAIRLLIPKGSLVLGLEGLDNIIEGFDPATLGYRWKNPDPRVDALQQEIQTWVMQAEGENLGRQDIFRSIWERAHRHAGRPVPDLPRLQALKPIPRLSENWYCCAEPTNEQLASF
jgi:radical SAM superfamily enzyme YgiQ (UPF0313 family)